MKHVWTPDRFVAALRFAAEYHRDQRVPGTDLPYLVHVVSVAQEVMAAISGEGAGDPDLAVQCALLHDTIEDTAATAEDVETAFGRDVASGVGALTKDQTAFPDKTDAMRDSLDRIKRQPREVGMVKLADRITNLAPPPAYWDDVKIAAYRDEARLILDALAPASNHLAERLRQRIDHCPPAR